MPALSRVASVFDRAADTYDAVGVPWFGPIARGLVDEVAVRAGERCLDLGCGRGAALLPLASAVGPTGRVLGVDLAPRMVELTAADVRDQPHVEVRVADAVAPGLPAATYDVVCASLVLFFLPDPGAAVRTWADLLVPGGRLGVSTFAAQDERWRAVDELFVPHLPPEVVDARTSGRAGPFASDEGVEALFTSAGLSQVRTAGQTVTVTFSGPEQWHGFSWSHGQRALWEAVPPERRDGVRDQAYALLGAARDPDGMIRLTQDVRYTLGEA